MTEQHEPASTDGESEVKQSGRPRWRTPQITVSSIEELTQLNSGNGADGGAHSGYTLS